MKPAPPPTQNLADNSPEAAAPCFVPDDAPETQSAGNRQLVRAFLLAVHEEGDMTIADLHQLAKALGIPGAASLFSETELVQHIQVACQQPPCFRADTDEFCHDPASCQWREQCRRLVAEWCR